MQPTKPNESQDAAAYIPQILEVCARLSELAQARTDSPLIAQVLKHIAKLSGRAQCLGKLFSHPERQGDFEADRGILDSLQSVRTLLFESLTLLDFCSAVEKDGDDGALNALYASLLILNDSNVDVAKVRYLKDRISRSNQEWYQTLSPWFGPEASSRNWWWGHGPRPQSDVLEVLVPEISCLLERTIATFSPRYIHTYDTARDVPYIVDNSAIPISGSYGIVRKIVDCQTQEVFAQKTFQNVFSVVDRKKVLKELGVLELCFHRNIIQLINAYNIDEEPHNIHFVIAPWAPYTLLQFLRGSDTHRKRKCPWFEPDLPTSDIFVYRMMHDIVDAIRYLHRLSIKHKDIKPDNILLHHDHIGGLIPVITDVGTSKVFRHGSNTDYINSSYQYLSPEQLRCEESSLKADIWQLGCCFAMLLSVARGGTPALNTLWTSFERTDEKCSCNIATEYGSFMQTLSDICTPGNAPQEHAHSLTCQMLDSDSSIRLDIETVWTKTERLPRY
ncbi:uncharacterized protein Z520_09388 [Fonsecaea multimorphosa CBS 102226]|uniref:Protein kinase domain-containing protein n=1 Tax=Fonsecaea multimorphosa CBS 102226 TaxID=1442371 RepID=A0A0D2KED4_9EURO|nr:uncharacterized protein Z520_09388 [Fonsecaea multimorphosa CBS 102226]KIX95078.1 hypothetical protein Z520_09388 [Fonsecaea multimorphosa CBS 102226]OAL20721.1 hypothetical protein AYO22_08730 [Fonsecaea multimorphosa]